MARLFRKRILAACSHFETLRHPDGVTDVLLLQEDVRASMHAGYEQSHRERLGYLTLDLDPAEVRLVDPKLAFHLGEHLAVLAARMISRARSGLKHISRPTAKYLFTKKTEVEAVEHVAQERPVFLLFPEPR